jgi:hypothetical protein
MAHSSGNSRLVAVAVAAALMHRVRDVGAERLAGVGETPAVSRD